ncbi:MAG: sporulation initiation inhibitor Soj [Verrucomicrobia bacterium GWC2_42_7]|nr:MAG: sporulation initiation inhibitor Soj [Verrucomicrobia bacterium GWC2_42_7]
MSATVFTIANQKGGVGKTTTAINLSVAIAKSGISTLLIDLDPQGNTTSGLGFEKKAGSSLYGALHGDENFTCEIKETSQKNLFLIPSEVDLAAVEIELGQKKDYLMQLKRCLDPLKNSGKYDAIIIDCPPALGMISMNSLAAADYLLIALQCEYLALEGLSQILKIVDQLKSAGVNEALKVGGIIMTMFDIRTSLSKQIVDEVTKHFSDLIFTSLIPRSIRLSEAPSFGQSIFEYDPLSTGAKAYSKLGQEVIKRFSLKKNA